MKTNFLALIILACLPIISYSQQVQDSTERQKSYHVEHYKIDVKLDLQKKTLIGKTTISIRSLVDGLRTFKIDAAGMKITAVKEVVYNATDKPELAEGFQSIKYDYNGNQITIDPQIRIAKNYPYKFQIEYSATDPEKGMYFISPDSIHPDLKYQVWTQGEDEDNHFWFPCYDYPNDKATSETIITINRNYTTLSNGVLIDVKDNKDSTRTWHWSLDKPHSSYLVMLAAGQFDTINDNYGGVPICTYVLAGQRQASINSFTQTADIVKFFSDYPSYMYPWHRFSQVVVENFIYGGMENTGAVVLHDRAICDDIALVDNSPIGLIAHELAHQWWGDNVTCKNWNEIWLNEGFATYFDALYQENLFGKDEYDYQIYSNQISSLLADSGSRRPIYAKDGLRTNTYDKGSCVLHMLRYVLGDADFKKALNIYIKGYEFGNVTTEDLISSVNSVFRDPLLDRTPKDFRWFFNEWIYHAGQPEYKAGYTYNENTKQISFTIQQVQDAASSSVFQIPVNVEIITPNNRFTQVVTSGLEPHTYTFSVDSKPLNVIFNKGNKVLCKLYFTKPKEDWLYQLLNSDDAIDRITAVSGLKDFINDNGVTSSLIDIMKNDKFWGVREEATEMLANANNEEIPDILIAQFKIESDPRIRRAIIKTLGNFYKNCPTCTNNKTLSNSILSLLDSESSYYTIGEGIEALSKIADKKDIYDMLIPFEKKDSHNEFIRRNLLDAMIVSKDPRATDLFMKYALQGTNVRLLGVALRGLGEHLDEQRVIDLLNSLLDIHYPYLKLTVINHLKKAANSTSKPFLQKELNKTYDEDFRVALNGALEAIK